MMIRGALLACFLTVIASQAWPSNCVQSAAIGPIVPTADAARELYKTIANIRHDPIKPTNDILVHDKGDHWEVFQYPKHAVVVGGGTLDLEIKKCDASTAGHYDR